MKSLRIAQDFLRTISVSSFAEQERSRSAVLLNCAVRFVPPMSHGSYGSNGGLLFCLRLLPFHVGSLDARHEAQNDNPLHSKDT